MTFFNLSFSVNPFLGSFFNDRLKTTEEFLFEALTL